MSASSSRLVVGFLKTNLKSLKTRQERLFSCHVAAHPNVPEVTFLCLSSEKDDSYTQFNDVKFYIFF